jgi:hypothetical protein
MSSKKGAGGGDGPSGAGAGSSSKAGKGGGGGGGGGGGKGKGGPKAEVLQFKSPAEFFAENQNIAGFDNVSSSAWAPRGSEAWKGGGGGGRGRDSDNLTRPANRTSRTFHSPLQAGKALYTTIREFVENSLDVSRMAGKKGKAVG